MWRSDVEVRILGACDVLRRQWEIQDVLGLSALKRMSRRCETTDKRLIRKLLARKEFSEMGNFLEGLLCFAKKFTPKGAAACNHLPSI